MGSTAGSTKTRSTSNRASNCHNKQKLTLLSHLAVYLVSNFYLVHPVQPISCSTIPLLLSRVRLIDAPVLNFRGSTIANRVFAPNAPPVRNSAFVELKDWGRHIPASFGIAATLCSTQNSMEAPCCRFLAQYSLVGNNRGSREEYQRRARGIKLPRETSGHIGT